MINCFACDYNGEEVKAVVAIEWVAEFGKGRMGLCEKCLIEQIHVAAIAGDKPVIRPHLIDWYLDDEPVKKRPNGLT